MKELVFILFFTATLILAANPTDLRIEHIFTPIETEFDVGDNVNFIFEVFNNGVYSAQSFDIGVLILDQNENTVFDEKKTEFYLSGFNKRTTSPLVTFSPENGGTFDVYIYVDYDEDTDRSNDTNKIELIFYEELGCEIDTVWNKANSFKIIKNIDYFPKDSILKNSMMLGDVIGISALIFDTDVIEHLCICGTDTASNLIEINDEVIYEWTLNGPGKLIIPDSNSNTILYELPICLPEDVAVNFVEISLNVRNSNLSNSKDEVISGKIKFEIREKYNKILNIKKKGLIVDGIIINELIEKNDELIIEKEGSSCLPENAVFDTYDHIVQTQSIKIDTSAYSIPDYLVMLSAKAVDYDRLKLNCSSDPQLCNGADSISIIYEDQLKYEWEVVSGNGVFPLGNIGRTVAFHKSRSTDTQVKCTISNINSNSVDNSIVRTYTLKPAKKPKAFVGIGVDKLGFDFEKIYRRLTAGNDVWIGRNEYLRQSAKEIETKLTSLGYEIEYHDVTTTNIMDDFLSDPSYQSFCFAQESSGNFNDIFRLSNDNSDIMYDDYNSSDLLLVFDNAYNCQYSPRIQDVILLTNINIPPNYIIDGEVNNLNNFFRFANIRYLKTYPFNNPSADFLINYDEFVNYAKKIKPLPPINKSLP